MDSSSKPSTALFEVYLRLRPSPNIDAERFLDVETSDNAPTHITIKPPATDHRKRAVEKFAFTRVFEENAAQLDLFNGTGVLPLVEGVLGAEGREGRDGLLATLGVSGSGKSHTILGSKTQRGLTQLSLDVLFQSLSSNVVDPNAPYIFPSLAAADVSESQLLPAAVFLDSVYGDGQSNCGRNSRAQTPMMVGLPITSTPRPSAQLSTIMSPIASPPSNRPLLPSSVGLYPRLSNYLPPRSPPPNNFTRLTRSVAKKFGSPQKDGASFLSVPNARRNIPRPSALPQTPNVHDISVNVDTTSDYAIVVSMYEVYNDRIYDLLANATNNGKYGPQKRRALLFKSTERSQEKKVVAGLRKMICANLDEALMVLETGLTERRVAGTGSNAVSSRSHGFFCIEVKKRQRSLTTSWTSSTLTIVDLAGSERARNAKTAGATLAEGGKINESLMYLGQCMQMQSDAGNNLNKTIVPFRQCKLTELLFTNSFTHHHHHRPQRSIMIVTADPLGDYNATSQILRYSALAREVTVPRIPSVTSTLLQNGPLRPTGRNSPTASNEELEAAKEEITHLTEEIDVLTLRLEEETSRRQAAEASWQAAEDHMIDLEADLRETLADEFEARLESERRRWKAAWDEEADMNDEKMDRKIELLSKAKQSEVNIYEDPEPTGSERMRELEDENAALRRKIEQLERETQLRSPTKKQRVLKAKKWEVDIGDESF